MSSTTDEKSTVLDRESSEDDGAGCFSDNIYPQSPQSGSCSISIFVTIHSHMNGTTKAVTLSIDIRLLERIDERRGLVSRSAFVRSLVEAGLGCSEKDGVGSITSR